MKGYTYIPFATKLRRIYKQELYYDFIEENPDYAPKSKMTISRTRFNKWLTAYGLFSGGVMPDEGRDMHGRWIIFKTKQKPKDPTLPF